MHHLLVHLCKEIEEGLGDIRGGVAVKPQACHSQLAQLDVRRLQPGQEAFAHLADLVLEEPQRRSLQKQLREAQTAGLAGEDNLWRVAGLLFELAQLRDEGRRLRERRVKSEGEGVRGE